MRFRPCFLRTTPARKPRSECCCQSVAVIKAAIVVPAGERSIARMRACLVSAPVLASDDERFDRERGLVLRLLRVLEGVGLLHFDLDLVNGVLRSSATPSAAPPQPRPGKTPARRATPKRAMARSSHVRQRSNEARRPVKSEQDNCSLRSYLLRTYELLPTRNSIGFSGAHIRLSFAA